MYTRTGRASPSNYSAFSSNCQDQIVLIITPIACPMGCVSTANEAKMWPSSSDAKGSNEYGKSDGICFNTTVDLMFQVTYRSLPMPSWSQAAHGTTILSKQMRECFTTVPASAGSPAIAWVGLSSALRRILVW